MSAEARYFRVGLFVLVGVALIGSCTVILGGRGLFKDPILLETYFDESVQGLEVGSPVKLRGVQLGTVSLVCDDTAVRLHTIGLAFDKGRATALTRPVDGCRDL